MTPTWKDVMKFELPDNPIIFDIGGFNGDWTQIALDEYTAPTIYVFEPVKQFYEKIKKRYADKKNVKVFHFGLSDSTTSLEISVSGDASSVFKTNGASETIQLKSIVEFMKEEGVYHVDLAKINIEGEEYRLLEHLVKLPELNIFNNFLIQFHKFVDNYEERRRLIQKELSKYYDMPFNFEMIFEGWSNKKVELINCVGDSHVSNFANTEKLTDMKVPSINNMFKTYRAGPYTAFNVNQKSDVKNYIESISDKESLLICFGEIDCRAQVKKVMENTNRKYREVIDEIIDNYIDIIQNFKGDNVYLCSITPCIEDKPHWYYYESHQEAFDCPKGTKEERNSYKEYFNEKLKSISSKKGYKFISIFDYVKDRKDFYLDDIHLSPKKVNYLIRREVLKLA